MADDKKPDDITKCPHCGEKLSKWQAADLNAWGNTTFLVCFNNDCPYYVRGWKWMEERFGTCCSYRYKINPETGEKGPLPVYDDNAGRSGIIED